MVRSHPGLCANGTPGISLLVDGTPRFGVAGQAASTSAFLDTGSPHHVMWLDQHEALVDLDLEGVALPVRHHVDHAPEGCNGFGAFNCDEARRVHWVSAPELF